METELPLRESYLQVESDLQAVTKLLQWFEQFDRPPVNRAVWMQGQLALTEGFTNAVRHAHEALPRTTPIELNVKVFTDKLEMRIWDRGLPFDLSTSLDSLGQPNTDPSERKEHWGSVILRKLKNDHAWVIQYTPTRDQKNCLLIQKILD